MSHVASNGTQKGRGGTAGHSGTAGFPLAIKRLIAVQASHQRFALDLASIRQLAGEKGPRKEKTGDLKETARKLRKEQCQRAEMAAELIGHELNERIAELHASLLNVARSADAEKKVWMPHLEELAIIALDRMGPSTASGIGSRFLEVCQGDSATANYAALLYQWKHSPTPAELLRPALVTILVSGFEDFLAALVRTWRLPGEASDYNDSEAVKLLTEASDYATDVLRQAPPEWCRKVSKEVGIDLEAITPERWHGACEVLARRNAIVHAGSHADERYLNRVSGFCNPPGLGAFLE